MNNEQPIIEVEKFWAGYGNQKVIDDVTMQIPVQGVTAIIGPSGCGKTTLVSSLNRISELNPGYCHGGAIRYQGIDIHSPEMDVDKLRKNVGLIFQKPTPFPLSVFANLEIPLREHYEFGRDELARKVNEHLERVGLVDELNDIQKTRADELSGGQQQRLCIARALTLNPSVLLCDEPCSSLDPISGERVENLLLSLSKSISVVVVTHNLAQARRMADQVLFFCDQKKTGQLIEQGSAEELFHNPKHELTRKYVSGLFG